jgi:hypothetical protein
MKFSPIYDQLQILMQTLGKIKTILAWQSLKRSEYRPDSNPFFIPPEDSDTELVHACSSFIVTAQTLEDMLHDKHIKLSAKARLGLQNDFRECKRQLNSLPLPQAIPRMY